MGECVQCLVATEQFRVHEPYLRDQPRGVKPEQKAVPLPKAWVQPELPHPAECILRLPKSAAGQVGLDQCSKEGGVELRFVARETRFLIREGWEGGGRNWAASERGGREQGEEAEGSPTLGREGTAISDPPEDHHGGTSTGKCRAASRRAAGTAEEKEEIARSGGGEGRGRPQRRRPVSELPPCSVPRI